MKLETRWLRWCVGSASDAIISGKYRCDLNDLISNLSLGWR